MKIIICNIPLRSENQKTSYPPLGAMYVIQALKTAGFGVSFYDINYFRPSNNEIEDYLKRKKPNIIGIGATVSTSYAYLKRLSALIRKTLPQCVIIVGGAITASSDIILKYTNVDFCVIGEGERIMVNLVKRLSENKNIKSDASFKNIKGLCFINKDGQVEFTGYEPEIPINEVPDPDYKIIIEDSKLDAYIIDPFYYKQFEYDRRSFEEKRKNKKLATVVTSRGCVARCTFCHRWQKGLRILSVDRVIQHIQFLMAYYNVGFVSFGDEDFGASEKWVNEFMEKIAPLDILYRISAIRVDHVSLPLLKRLRESGCIAIHYGLESGSSRILKVIEKNATVQENIEATLWTYEAGLQTVPAFVIGMPGENYSTIKETSEFAKKITEYYPYEPIVGMNLLVALPGTPVYEYARYKGFLGATLEDEEQYLMRISDHGGESPVQFNFTDYPYFIVQSWVRCIIVEVLCHYYYSKNALSRLSYGKLFHSLFLYFLGRKEKYQKQVNFRIELFSHSFIYHLRHVIILFFIIGMNFKEVSFSLFLERCLEMILWPFKKKSFVEYISLRSFMNKQTHNLHEIKIQPTHLDLLRLGR